MWFPLFLISETRFFNLKTPRRTSCNHAICGSFFLFISETRVFSRAGKSGFSIPHASTRDMNERLLLFYPESVVFILSSCILQNRRRICEGVIFSTPIEAWLIFFLIAGMRVICNLVETVHYYEECMRKFQL